MASGDGTGRGTCCHRPGGDLADADSGDQAVLTGMANFAIAGVGISIVLPIAFIISISVFAGFLFSRSGAIWPPVLQMISNALGIICYSMP